MSDTDYNNTPEESKISFVNGDRPYNPQPQRHGFITFWLIFGLILNCITVLILVLCLTIPLKLPKISPASLMMLVVIGAFGIFFYLKLISYKKSGFYGLITLDIITYLLNLSIGLSFLLCTVGLIGIPLLYCILQLKKNGISTWKLLK